MLYGFHNFSVKNNLCKKNSFYQVLISRMWCKLTFNRVKPPPKWQETYYTCTVLLHTCTCNHYRHIMHVTVAVLRLILLQNRRTLQQTSVRHSGCTECCYGVYTQGRWRIFSNECQNITNMHVLGTFVWLYLVYFSFANGGNVKLFTATKFHKFHMLKLPLHVILFLHGLQGQIHDTYSWLINIVQT